MLYSKLGRTGLIVSKLTLGTMTFTSGGGNAAIAKTDLSQSDQIVGTAIDAGINFFDTADVYSEGQSEEILGKVLGARRHDVIIATKAGWRMGEPLNRTGLSASHLHWSIDQSLKRLGTDYVDVYIAHRNDLHTPLEETLIALDAIVKSGKARYLGVSNWPAWKVAAAIELQRANGWAPFTHAQMMYSLLGRGIEGEIMPMLQNYGLGLTAWSPLAGGFLSGKYTRESLKDSKNRLSGFDMIPFDKEHGFALIKTLREIAAAHNATVAQVALAWVLGRSSVSSALIGASRISQLEDNLAAVNVRLTDEDRARLEIQTAPDLDFSIGVTQVPDGPITNALANSPGALSNEKANPAS
jgi:aryl-alcohol dehydrogenase-like predicted oxidoreductase